MKRKGVVLIAALEIGGGFAGLAFASQLALQSISVPSAAFIFSMVSLPMFLSLRAGQLLWMARPGGRTLSLVVQLLQVPIIYLNAGHYDFFVGGRLALLWMRSDLFPRVDLGSGLSVGATTPDTPVVLGVNLLALWAAWYLWRLAPIGDMRPAEAGRITQAAA